ncbi:type III pantothenate kinase [Rhodohalobacter sp.]|uniref:type III pantothenate kinase n=1 Tax=Rhodohalobacter sp. TaxID=1974210 RepID=UPI002ACE6BF1|nr:type III pantothenate kinase [Rhodohalobacter sp.]MDZ7757884.1 type III pantothenate kinase [Rhodohalobacter sp.]
MSILYLDIGNSHIKLAKKTGIKWEIIYKASNGTADNMAEVVKEYPDTELVVISSVREDLLKKLLQALHFVELKVLTNSLIDRDNLDYNTPETLGMDRFLTCYGALSITDNDIICIDAGTACTVDWMTNEGIYRGGIIMPGLKLFHKAIDNEFRELPSVEYRIPGNWPGKTTAESVQWGTGGSFVMAIEGFIRKYMEHIDSETDLFITGGDSFYLMDNLQSSLKVHHRPHLLFDGMEMFWKDQENLT